MSLYDDSRAGNPASLGPTGPPSGSMVIDEVTNRIPVRELDPPSHPGLSAEDRAYSLAVKWRQCVARVEVTGDVESNRQVIENVAEEQMRVRVAEIRRVVAQQLWADKEAEGAPRGMSAFAVTVSEKEESDRAGAVSLELAHLDELLALLPDRRSSDSLAYAMNGRMLGMLERKAESAGTPLRPSSDAAGPGASPSWRSIPILICDWISASEADAEGVPTTSIYLVRLDSALGGPPGGSGVSFVVPRGGRDPDVSTLQRGVDGLPNVWSATASWTISFDAGTPRSAIARKRRIRSR